MKIYKNSQKMSLNTAISLEKELLIYQVVKIYYEKNKVIIIAEAGVNHNGKLSLAKNDRYSC